jgi:hypothetical protein
MANARQIKSEAFGKTIKRLKQNGVCPEKFLKIFWGSLNKLTEHGRWKQERKNIPEILLTLSPYP